MIGVINRAERNLFAEPPEVITLVQNVAQEIFPSEVKTPTAEIAYRYIQNTGANPCFYTLGTDAGSTTPANAVTAGIYHGVIPAGGQLDISNHRLRVCCICTVAGGTSLGTTIIRRNP